MIILFIFHLIGVIHPRAVSNLRYKFIDDPERRQEKLLKVELEWEHSPGDAMKLLFSKLNIS